MATEFESYASEGYLKSRKQKAKKIISILKKFKDLKKSTVLDVGVGFGVITSELAKHCKEVRGVDVIDERKSVKGYKFKKVKDASLPFKNESFDIVVSNYVLEHVRDQKKHIDEVYRVLKKDGICYLSTPNKFWLMESHYKLPFLSMLPQKVARIYLKIFRKGAEEYNIVHLSYSQILKLVSVKFVVKDFTFEIMKHPEEYHLEKNLASLSKLLSKFRFLKWTFPGYVFILKKK